MKEFISAQAIQSHLLTEIDKNKSIGFVPTMGALHEGHLTLIRQAKAENDIVVCSIFVNPLQFNRKEDLDSYPMRLNEDKRLLEQVECDVVFIPTVEEIYPKKPDLSFEFGSIGYGMEANYRPGHFYGVAAVVKRFFEILNPDKAYFGEKDYQQLAIIRWLVKEYSFEIEVVPSRTVRFENGLAMSSRNFNLPKTAFEVAAKIHELMLYAKENVGLKSPFEIERECKTKLQADFKVDYVTIADENSMKPIQNWEDSEQARIFIAAYLHGVRLIDNMALNN